ncbi:MAG: ferritin-like domain-containing protein [Methylococcales bacterium]
MENLFELAESCLVATTIAEKGAITKKAGTLSQSGQLDFNDDQIPPDSIVKVRFPEQPVLINPRELPRRTLATQDGRIALLHAIAHIEFTAILLAWDIIYRFRSLPIEFYKDWLKVASEEFLHFSMVRERLKDYELDYGDLPAHDGLWEVAVDSSHDVLVRLAIVPRCMEARGLDVTPAMIDKLIQHGDIPSAKVLTRILRDEVGHVEIGSRWFKTLCEKRKVDSEDTYFQMIDQYLRTKVRGPFNLELRRAAGFSEAELERLQRL